MAKWEKKSNWIKWDNLRKNKGDGGMGFRDLHAYHKALLAKQAWIILQNLESLWVKTLKSIYFPNKTFLKAKYSNNSSWLGKSIIKGRDLLKKWIRWEIGNGEKVDFWKDPWIPSINKFTIQSIKPIDNNINKVNILLIYYY